MTVSLRGAGTIAANTANPAPSYPAGVQTTDLSVLTVMAKPTLGTQPQDVTCATPSGWTLLFAGSAGTTPPNTDDWSGSMVMWIFTRTGGTFSGSVPLTLTNNSVAAAVINTYAGNGTGWNTSTVYGYHNDIAGNAFDSNKTVASTNLGINGGDWMLISYAGPWLAALGSPTITAAGTTLGAANLRSTAGSTAGGYNSRLETRDLIVTSGTSTAGPRMTSSTFQDGIAVFIRLREGVVTISGSETVSTVERSTLGAQVGLPVVRDWANGDFLDAATLNAAWRDPIAWMLTEAPGIQLEVTTVVTLNSASHTITWDKIRYRRGSITVSGTKVSVPTTGHYIGQFSVGLRDNGTMGFPFVTTVDILVYPGGLGAATVHNVSTNYDPLDAEGSFAIGSQPFSVYLNEGDAIEVKLSGAWNTAGGTQLWVAADAAALAQGFVPLLDLHWFSTWDGVSR